MSVLSRNNWTSQQRVDLSDFLALESYNAFDLRTLVAFSSGIDRAYIVRGFEAVGQSGLSLSVRVANSIAFNPQDGAGAFYTGLSTDPDIIIDLPSSQSNIFVEATFSLETQNPVNKGIWDAISPSEDAAGQEFNASVDTQVVLTLNITANTIGFNEGAIPILRASTGASSITNLIDSRPLFFRLGTGGTNPDPLNKFNFSPSRSEPVSQGTGTGDSAGSPWQARDASGALNDKAFRSMKEWMDAVMTRIAEGFGSPIWYLSGLSTAPSANVSLNQTFFDTLGHNIQPSKNAAFKWDYDGADLKLSSEGTIPLNGTTSQYHSGLIRWQANYSGLEWHIGGTFVNNTPGGKRNYTSAGLRFLSGAPADKGNIYLVLEREAPKGSGNTVSWSDNSAEGSFALSQSVSGQVGDFTGIALGDYIRKESEGYSRYLKVVRFSDGTTTYNNANASDENRIADSTIVALELESTIISGGSIEPLRFFRSRYSSADIVVDSVSGVYSFQDANAYWLGRRVDNLFYLRNYGTMQPGEEVTTIDVIGSQGNGGGAADINIEHSVKAEYNATHGYRLNDATVATLLTIRRRKRDNTEAVPGGGSNADALLTYTIAAPVGLLAAGQSLWVRLSDTTGGTLASGSVTNSTDDEENTDTATNRWEVRNTADTPLRNRDNLDVFKIAERAEFSGKPGLIFFDGSVIAGRGLMLNQSVEITDDLLLAKQPANSVLFTNVTAGLVDTDAGNFEYDKVAAQLRIFNTLVENNRFYQVTPEDISFFDNLGAHTLTVGSATSTVHVRGDLIVDGSYVSNLVENVHSRDKLISLGVGSLVDEAAGGGIELADDTRTSTQIDSTVGQDYVDITHGAAHGYILGDVIGVSTSDDVGGITAGQIGGQYDVVATATAPGEAEVISATVLRVYSRGTATSTETSNDSPTLTFRAPWSIRLGGSNGAYSGVTSWVFRVKGQATTPALTPVTDYGVVPTAHSTAMLATRIPFVNDDNAGALGADTTLNFSPNFTWNNNTLTFTVVGTTIKGGGVNPDTTNTFDLGSTSLRWRLLYMGTGAGSGIRIGDSSLYEDSANQLKTDDDLIVGGVAIFETNSRYVEFTGNNVPTLPPSGEINVFARGGLMYQQEIDGNLKLLTNPEGSIYNEPVDVVVAPSGNNEMGEVTTPPTTVSIPEGTKELIGTSLAASVSVGDDTVSVAAIGHGLTTGDTANVVMTSTLGGISAGNLSGAFTVTVLDVDNFEYTAAAAAGSTASGFIDRITAQKSRTYTVGICELQIFLDGVYQREGVDYNEIGAALTPSTQVEWLKTLEEGQTVTYHITQGGGRLVVFSGGAGVTDLQSAYNNGQTINAATGAVAITGSGTILNVAGNATVSGLLSSVTGLTFTPQGSAPFGASVNGLYVDPTSKDLLYGRDSLTTVNLVDDFIRKDGVGIGVLHSSSNGLTATSLTKTYTNNSGVTITLGEPVYISAAGEITRASAGAAATAAGTVGVAAETILNGNNGLCVVGGSATALLEGGGSFSVGDRVYLALTAGRLTHTPPTTVGEVVVPMGVADSTTTVIITVGEPIEIA